MDENLETVDCNLCESNTWAVLYDFDPFKVVRCKNCDLIFVNPRLKEESVADIYKDGYFKNSRFFSDGKSDLYGYSDYEESRGNVEAMYKKILRQVETFKKPGTLLEIGSAYDYFLNIARQNGWQVSGIEMVEEAASYSKKKFGIEPFLGTLEHYPPNNQKFDVIAFFDVLEHFHDPTKALETINSMLNPGGNIVLAVPNSSRWVLKLLGRKWEDLQRAKSNEHLFFFDQGTVKKMLNKCGFEMMEVKTMGRTFKLNHLCDRLQIYNQGFFLFINRVIKFLGLQDISIHLNPGLKLIVYAKKQ